MGEGSDDIIIDGPSTKRREIKAEIKKRDSQVENVIRIAEDKINKEDNMAEKLETEITAVDEIKHQKLKEQEDFKKRVNEAINANVDNKKEIGEVKGMVGKLMGELCEGPDCLKEKVGKKVGDIEDEMKKMREEFETFVCENCGKKVIRKFDSFCPNCAYPIPEWLDEDSGQPVASWTPYWRGREKEYGLDQ